MSDERRELARDFAVHLQHLRRYKGLNYAPGGRATPFGGAPVLQGAPPPADDPRTWAASKKLAYLRDEVIGDCRRCPLHARRRNIVFGVGNAEADLMFVGEAPGADEDRLGDPFVGKAGQKLDAWLGLLGLARSSVYIANVLKCRPPGNRDPVPLEVERCSPFLHAQIRAVQPRAIVALGRHAGFLLTRREELSLRAMRSQRLVHRDPKTQIETPVFATYHPAYVLRQESAVPREGAASPGDVANENVLADVRKAMNTAGVSTAT